MLVYLAHSDLHRLKVASAPMPKRPISPAACASGVSLHLTRYFSQHVFSHAAVVVFGDHLSHRQDVQIHLQRHVVLSLTTRFSASHSKVYRPSGMRPLHWRAPRGQKSILRSGYSASVNPSMTGSVSICMWLLGGGGGLSSSAAAAFLDCFQCVYSFVVIALFLSF